jgi:hypothetical protein
VIPEVSKKTTREGKADFRLTQRLRPAAASHALSADHIAIERYLTLSIAGLPQFFTGTHGAHTARLQNGGVRTEGQNLRYEAISALGIACLDPAVQRGLLGGRTAHDLARSAADEAGRARDHGAAALGAWAVAEVGNEVSCNLVDRLQSLMNDPAPIETVVCAWALSAALASPESPAASALRDAAALRLLTGCGRHGLFPHLLPLRAGGRLRAHVGCFADQVYPIQALARLHVTTGQPGALDAANACAAQICRLQGLAGQWWWHYDVRTGAVVEGYPVYSVHQHAMAPMALFDLAEAGGRDFSGPVSRGLRWIENHPEAPASNLIDAEHGLIWRKIARGDSGKIVRKVAAAVTAVIPNSKLPGVDTLFPPASVDYECRPYELGWMLYAWLRGMPQRSVADERTAA